MLKRELILEGLDCANCAAKIEYEVNELNGINAHLNFMTRTLTVEMESLNLYENALKQVELIVNKHEPDVVVKEKNIPLTKAETEESQYHSNTKKQITKLILGGSLFAAGIIFNFPNGLELAVFIICYIIVGGSVVLRAFKGIVSGQIFSEHFLMTIATLGAFGIGEYTEGVAVMLFYLVGEMFQDRAVDNSRKSISSLLNIRADYAHLQIGNELHKVAPENVNIGDIIVVKPGEKIPLDGKVIAGTSMVDTSALTGESIPRQLGPGQEALSGFINKNSVLTIEVTKDYSASTVAKILDLVQNASSRKAPTENFITKFARYYTPVVVFSALALAIIPPLVIEGATFADWIYRALVFLVISCPCALVISIPLGFFAGIGGASKKGILVKGSNYLEALNSVETVIFDKTGTLTQGVFKVTAINPSDDYSNEELIEYAAYAESYSNHPIALSIQKACYAAIDKNRIDSYEEIVGQGIRAIINGKEVLVGNNKLMESCNIKYNQIDTLGTVVYVAVNQKYAGNIIISDEIKEDSAQAIKELKVLGIKKTVMLTGDIKAVGDKIGQQLGLDEIYSELLPADKVDKLELLESKKNPQGKLAFVGDGINDAPVLARADIGIAMGGLGSDAAIEAADIVIMTDEPSKIATAIKIAHKTRIIVYQNIVLALGIKLVFLVLGAAGVATMWEAVFADTGVAVLAILNAMRALKN